MSSLSMILLARTSLYGSCCVAPLPPFIRQRLSSIIFHFFFSHPSEVLSGDIKLTGLPDAVWSNKIFPTSSENVFSKKFTCSHVMPEFFGHTQYWSDRLNPRHFSNSICVEDMCNFVNAFSIPIRLAGIARPFHHALSAALLMMFFFTGIPTGTRSFSYTIPTVEIAPEASSNSKSATGKFLCINVYFFMSIALLSANCYYHPISVESLLSQNKLLWFIITKASVAFNRTLFQIRLEP